MAGARVVISHLLIAMVCMASDPRGAGREVEEAWVSMPQGDVFAPLLADPKQPQPYATALWARTKFSSELIAAVAYGDTVGLVRWPGPREGEGWQLGISGAVFAQFDLLADSAPLLNADYMIGGALSRRRRAWSGRMRVYHQSSHLGDEIVLAQQVERVQLDYEAFELIAAADLRTFRPYAGGELLFRRRPSSLPVAVWHGGLEYRHPRRFAVGARVEGQLVAGADAKRSWSSSRIADVSVRGGVELGPRVVDHAWRRRLAVLAQLHEGGSPSGQFFVERVSFLGIGVHFIL
jgi:hypothetical protein